MNSTHKYQSVFAIGLLVFFFMPWGEALHLAGSGYEIALQLGGHVSILLLIPVIAAELLVKNKDDRYTNTLRLIIAALAFIVYFVFISHGGIGSILFLIPVMAFELLVKSLVRENTYMKCAVFGLTTLCILGFGAIYLAGEDMKYLVLFQNVSIGFYASIVFGLLMVFIGAQGVRQYSGKKVEIN